VDRAAKSGARKAGIAVRLRDILYWLALLAFAIWLLYWMSGQ